MLVSLSPMMLNAGMKVRFLLYPHRLVSIIKRAIQWGCSLALYGYVSIKFRT